MKSSLFPLAAVLLMQACHTKTKNSSNDSHYEPAQEVMEMHLNIAPPPPAYEMVKFVPPSIRDDAEESETITKPVDKTSVKKIIKDGTISIKTKSPEVAKKHLDKLVEKLGAYYETEQLENTDYRSAYNLVIRVPSAKFEEFVTTAEKGEGEVTYKSIDARDVTEDYTDTEIRLNSKRIFRKRYNELLTRATKVDDILAIQENIRVLQEEIESKEGHLKFVDDQVAFSKVELTLYHVKEAKIEKVKIETFTELVTKSLGGGWQSVVNALLWSVRQWPWLIVVYVIFMSIRIYRKKNSHRG